MGRMGVGRDLRGLPQVGGKDPYKGAVLGNRPARDRESELAKLFTAKSSHPFSPEKKSSSRGLSG